jgi:hypothetical protein
MTVGKSDHGGNGATYWTVGGQRTVRQDQQHAQDLMLEEIDPASTFKAGKRNHHGLLTTLEIKDYASDCEKDLGCCTTKRRRLTKYSISFQE